MPPQFYLNLTFAPPEMRTTPQILGFPSTRGVEVVADMSAISDIGVMDKDLSSKGDTDVSDYSLRGLNDSYPYNSTFNGTTFINGWGGSMYPSGYSMYEIAAIALFISFAMVVVVVGNMLVIIAIATENALKHITNWFIASLAVSDLLLGLVIMPFSLANLLMGYWVFGELWCELHSAIDVLLSTASINNICLISLDRYWSITHAVDYLKDRTPKKAAFMIVSVWVISGLISIPPLLGWKVDGKPEEFPKCTVSDEIGYVLYSAFGSFYVPSCIMIFVYIQIYYAAKARARKGIPERKKNKPPKKESCCAKLCACLCCRKKLKLKKKKPKEPHLEEAKEDKKKGVGTNTTSFSALPERSCIPSEHRHCSKAGSANHKKVHICDVRVHQEHSGEERTSPGTDDEPSPLPRPLRTLSEQVDADHQNHNVKGENGIYLRPSAMQGGEGSLVPPPTPTFRDPSGSGASSASPVGSLRRGGSRGTHSIDGEQMSDMDPSSSDSGAITRCSVIQPLKKRFCQPLIGKKNLTKPKRELIDMGRVSTPSYLLDPEREKKRIARKKEKRATLILGLIMGSFIACWLPFFFMYILVPLCPYCYIPGYAFDLAFWLGYMNSAFNPVIYTIFNQDFRKAFRKILFK